jgi:MFS family permease
MYGYLFSLAGLGATIGPVVGGVFALADWRWIFYLNLPVCGVALGVILPCLRLNYTRDPTMKKGLAQVDFLGNAIFMAAMIALLFGLVMGGVQYPWHSWRIILSIA